MLVMRRIEPSEIAKAAAIWRGRLIAPLPVTAETRRRDGENLSDARKEIEGNARDTESMRCDEDKC